MKAVEFLRCDEEHAENYIGTSNMVFSIAGNTPPSQSNLQLQILYEEFTNHNIWI